MGKNANNRRPGTPTSQGIPVEHIQAIADTIPDCSVTIKRRNARGQFSTIPGCVSMAMKTIDLLEIEKFIEEAKLGGGSPFVIEARNPNGVNPEPYFVAKFELYKEGAPLNPQQTSNNPLGMQQNPYGGPPMPFGMPFMPPNMPPVPPGPGPAQAPPKGWSNGLTPQDQAVFDRSNPAMAGYNPYYPPYYQPPAPVASIASDKLAVDQLNKMSIELGQLRASLDAEHKKAEERSVAHQAKLEEMRREHERDVREMRERHAKELADEKERREEDRRRQEDRERERLEQERQRERLELERRITESKESKGDRMTEMLMLMMKGNEGSKASEMQMQFKMMEMSQASNDRMLAAIREMQQTSSKADVLALEMLKQNSPEQKSALLERTMEMQMTMAGAMMNLVQASAGENPPAWLEIAMRAMDGLGGVVEGLMEKANGPQQPQQQQRALPPPGARRALPAGTTPPKAVAQPPRPSKAMAMETIEIEEPEDNVVDMQQESTVEQAVQPAEAGSGEHEITLAELDATVEADLENPEREAVTAQIDKLAPIIPDDFRTREWRKILIELHMKTDVEAVADLVVGHLEHLIRFDDLPKRLARLQADPAGTLRPVFGFLPIARQAPEYVDAVLTTIVDFLGRDGFLATSDEDSEENDEETEAVA